MIHVQYHGLRNMHILAKINARHVVIRRTEMRWHGVYTDDLWYGGMLFCLSRETARDSRDVYSHV
jgi:hypothetical protein